MIGVRSAAESAGSGLGPAGGMGTSFAAMTPLSPAALFSYTTGILTSAGPPGGGGHPNLLLDSDYRKGDDIVGTDRYSMDQNSQDISSRKKVMLVFVVGGLSYLEVAAFRFLSKDPSFPFTIVMATTKFISGNTFVNSLQL